MAIDFDDAQAADASELDGAGAPSMNITPLIDVLLVLLVMLIITIPIQLHAVSMDMPGGLPPPQTTEPVVVHIDITADNLVLWNGELLAGRGDLLQRMQQAALQPEVPEIHVKASSTTRYDTVAAVLSVAQQTGLQKVGVVGLEAYSPAP